MKRIISALVALAVIVTCGRSFAEEEPGPNFEHLKAYGPMLGTWRYEGPLHEEITGIGKKGSKLVFQFSWKRILNKNAVEENWLVEFEGGKTLTGKALIGWDPTNQRIVYGGMDSIGEMSLGTVEFDRAAKTSTLTARGRDGAGQATSFKGVVTKTGKDTLTWQALEQQGGIVEGPSAVYEFKRIKRSGPSKAGKKNP